MRRKASLERPDNREPRAAKRRLRQVRDGKAEATAGTARAALASTLLRGALTKGSPRANGLGTAISRHLLNLQTEHGNAYVGRLIRRGVALPVVSTAAVQRKAEELPAPGIPGEAAGTVQKNLKSNRQAAVDALASALAARGDIDLSFLEGRKIGVVSDSDKMKPGHSGHTSLTPGSGRPRPCIVVVGPDAFSSAGNLYATVMHEWQHVLQFRAPDIGSEPAGELEARLWEVDNLEQTGLWRDIPYLQVLRTQIDYWWRKMSPEERAPFKERYDAAFDTILSMIRRRLKEKAGGRQEAKQ